MNRECVILAIYKCICLEMNKIKFIFLQVYEIATDTDNHEENKEDNGMQKCCFRPLSVMQIS